MSLYVKFRRWAGFGCKQVPWEGAGLNYRCELSRNHNDPHNVETANGPVTWLERWDMPPLAPFVREPKEVEFGLVGWKTPEQRYVKIK